MERQGLTVSPYVKSVLDPFNTPACKGPSEFGTNSALAEKRTLHNFAPNVVISGENSRPGEMFISLYPQNIYTNGTTDPATSFNLFDWKNPDDLSQSS